MATTELAEPRAAAKDVPLTRPAWEMLQNTYELRVAVIRNQQGFVLRAINLPEAVAHGDTMRSAVEGIISESRRVLWTYRSRNAPIPWSSSAELPSGAGEIRVRLNVVPLSPENSRMPSMDVIDALAAKSGKNKWLDDVSWKHKEV